MAVISVLTITGEDTAADSLQLLQRPTDWPQAEMAQLANYFQAVASGIRQADLEVNVNAVKASATVTCATTVTGNTVTIAGVTLTADTDFDVGADDEATATNLAAAINAHETLSDWVSAEAAAEVVTITALDAGAMGNAITLASSGETVAVSAARLEDGSDGTSKTYSF